MNPSHQFDAYAKPPSHIREVYKKYQKPSQALDSDPEIVDFKRGLTESQCNDIKVIGRIPKERLAETFNAFGRANYNRDSGSFGPSSIVSDASIYEHHQLPGRGSKIASTGLWLMECRATHSAICAPG